MAITKHHSKFFLLGKNHRYHQMHKVQNTNSSQNLTFYIQQNI